ncbi:DNA repair protein RecN [Anaerobium acetethylicum]|uniref:DNA repair protein RecN n=1 Tax=Anaerobium acetethylicum TaxID=1619234 RepID=A0A1D3TNJ8_9FIRM|nr:DNA repair protein RecN [Anaerobium acetethylicum]SCP94899.1 DNA repair protein RecN (Recombination protein N) [Anaerobium acetethylicum]
MLLNLHVKNLALIDEADVYFNEGLNILTGETGAGKSIIIGSINLALGGKVSKDIIRESAEYALVELVFQLEDGALIDKIKALDVMVEEDRQIILSRKIMKGKSVSKVNGETVTASALKSIGELLIDIHGQHEHQSLLNKKKHLEILDEFAKKELGQLKDQLSKSYRSYLEIREEYENSILDEDQRARELAFAEFETGEIAAACLVPGEDKDLEAKHRRLLNGKKIMDAVKEAYNLSINDESDSAMIRIGRSVREIGSVVEYDSSLEGILSQLEEIDALLNDFSRDLTDYASQIDVDSDSFFETEERLNTIHHLKSKYGDTIEKVLAYQAEKEKRLEQLRDYEAYIEKLSNRLKKEEENLLQLSDRISEIRKGYALNLVESVREALVELNFLEVRFEMKFTRLDHFTANGTDEAEFMISTNPGEKLRPLGSVASGGELSRIMLAVKTVLADKDATDTLIFDEIDTGISGRTAQMVSEKLAVIGRAHQVICITHLPQIAAMADSHYAIEKNIKNNGTITSIRKLNDEEIIAELSRILGGASITDKVTQSAREMKELAAQKKAAMGI